MLNNPARFGLIEFFGSFVMFTGKAFISLLNVGWCYYVLVYVPKYAKEVTEPLFPLAVNNFPQLFYHFRLFLSQHTLLLITLWQSMRWQHMQSYIAFVWMNNSMARVRQIPIHQRNYMLSWKNMSIIEKNDMNEISKSDFSQNLKIPIIIYLKIF